MDYTEVLGLGVAGNFAGHLEQAGEAKDFANVKTVEKKAPKALFPFYLPKRSDLQLGTFPLTSYFLNIKDGSEKVQLEPEVAIAFEITYDQDQVVALTPLWFGAYNDCSIRREGAKKISEKKNWGENCKGFAKTNFQIDTLAEGGVLDHYRIASFLYRDDVCYEYGIDSAIRDYNYFHEDLVNWIIDHMNNQQDEGPMENIHELILASGKPQYCLISIGATRYTEFGEKNFLKINDRAAVVVYSEKDHSPEEIKQIMKDCRFVDLKGSLLFHQVVGDQ